MDYRAITNKASEQWQLQKSAYTDANGLRKMNDRYMIAVGSYFTKDIGEWVDVYLDNGLVLPCIVGDAKADKDTINGHSTGTHNDAIEFIVETGKLHSVARTRGDISFVPGFSGSVKFLEVGENTTDQEIMDTLSTMADASEKELEVPEEVNYVQVSISTEKPIVMNILEENREA